jgi:type II restriction/modification system DNA methylase subunit YeeA
VLDPACGSGNFLYLALLALKDLEQRVNLDAEALGFQRAFPAVGPQAVRGIEINAYAADLARVSVWIGEIQWMLRNGYNVPDSPILKSLDNIECRDAILSPTGGEAAWPDADVIIGNPPFLGKTKQLMMLGARYVEGLRAAFSGRVPSGADLVTYWLEKARSYICEHHRTIAGFVATQAVRTGASGEVLKAIADTLTIFHAWADEPWVVDGASVRVSVICFARREQAPEPFLDGKSTTMISHSLRAISRMSDPARLLEENAARSFHGVEKAGDFDVPGQLARQWLSLPLNPNGFPNSDVLRPLCNGRALTARPNDMWIIDFSHLATEEQAALFEAPFAHVVATVRTDRLTNSRAGKRKNWWRHGEVSCALQFDETPPCA